MVNKRGAAIVLGVIIEFLDHPMLKNKTLSMVSKGSHLSGKQAHGQKFSGVVKNTFIELEAGMKKPKGGSAWQKPERDFDSAP